jgi:aldoxime dehydratase
MSAASGRKPAGWKPPYPSWSGRFDKLTKPVIFGYIGCQYDKENLPVGAFQQWWARAAGLMDGPVHSEWASYSDTNGKHNLVALCYWLDMDAHDRWWQNADVGAWWADGAREQDGVGYWREINVVAPDKFETVFSSQNPVGLAQASDGFSGEVEDHGYWGSMRDRIPASAHDRFLGSLAAVRPAIPHTTSARRRLRLPENLAMIRSGQDWRECGPIEREYYLRDVHPVLMTGMDFLRDNSEASGCLSCRFMTSQDDGSRDQVTFGSALFKDLADLELWAEKHPTHVAIFGAFLKMVRTFNGVLDLRLWHEVIIVDGSASTYEYLNCNAETGALRWLV